MIYNKYSTIYIILKKILLNMESVKLKITNQLLTDDIEIKNTIGIGILF